MARSTPSFSLQRTLAIRFSLTMFGALLGLALWGYLGVRNTLMEQLDRSLESAARLQVDNLAAHGSLAVHKSVALNHFIEDVNRFVVIHDSAGRILTSNTALAHDLPLETIAFRKSRQGRRTLSTQQWHGHGFRSIYLPVPRMGRTEAAVIQVGASLIPLEASLSTVLLQMVGTVLLVTLATAIGAGWLAASAVAPVHQITAQARAITAELSGTSATTCARRSLRCAPASRSLSGASAVPTGIVACLRARSRRSTASASSLTHWSSWAGSSPARSRWT